MKLVRHMTAFIVGVSTSTALLFSATDVFASNVAQGCAAPNVTKAHNTFYVDPVRGSMSGDGSKARPWHTLAEVFDVRNHLLANAPATSVQGVGIVKAGANAPIKSGDTILLMSGNHGSPSIQGYFGYNKNTLLGYNNSDFITVAAAPGQTPVVTSLGILGAAKWIFQGIVFQSLQNVPTNLGQPFVAASSAVNDYYLAYVHGPSSDIIFNSNVFQSQADISNWTTTDWLRKRASGLLAMDGKCFSITNNLFQNVGFALSTANQTNVLIQNNTINYFSDDGIDYGSNNLVIDNNHITNSIEDNDGFHRDAMQGVPGRTGVSSNIQITNNYVNNQTTKLVAVGQLQGIDSFDGKWQNLKIENNIVITNTYHGITFYGASNINVINNTVIGAYSDLVNDVKTWIDIGPSNSGSASQNVIVRNNLASYFVINASGATIDHNLLVTLNPNAVKYYSYSAGVPSGALASKVFASFNTKALSFDTRLLSNTSAVNGGTIALAPPTDLRGLSRGKGPTTSLGALVYGGGPVGQLSNALASIATAATATMKLGSASPPFGLKQ